MTDRSSYFSSLWTQLSRRSARAVLSQLALSSVPLRDHLRDLFESSPSRKGSLISEPVFEAMFGWEPAPPRMADLKGKLLHPQLVDAMDAPPQALTEHRFSRDWHPHTHQLAAWQRLSEAPPRSVVVSSGTGSGKTECFLVPILNDLAMQQASGTRLIGVQALFLYPLNALINSQRDRLRAWSSAFNGKIRFCLYNGETRQTVRQSEQRKHPEEVLSRSLLRDEPPPILVTNATMLEYMLVRNEDRPIIDASYSGLRWIVLDEAHTYVGSQAAELSLLLRRVMHAFGVNAEQVRFVATSATIGDEESSEQLRDFLADLAGVTTERVSVVLGKRLVPDLDEKFREQSLALPRLKTLSASASKERFELLAASTTFRRLRNHIAKSPMTLSQATEVLMDRPSTEPVSDNDLLSTIGYLDLATSARRGKEDLLPLRGHFFHRTQGGLWTCSNRTCSGRKGTLLDRDNWHFGKVFLERRERCDACDAPVFEAVICSGCGAEYLAAEETRRQGIFYLQQRSFARDEDEFQLEFEAADDGETTEEEEDYDDRRTKGQPRLVTGPGCQAAETIWVKPDDGSFTNRPNDGLTLGLVQPEPVERTFTCPRCRTTERYEQEIFRPARVGAPFFLSVAIPTLLEHNEPGKGEVGDGPFQGRRLLTFSDSRQGTARFAVKAQLDAERNHIRGVIYHQVARSRTEGKTADISELEKSIGDLEAALQASPGIPTLQQLLTGKRDELKTAREGKTGRISWQDAASALTHDNDVRRWLPDQWHEYALGQIPRQDVARFCLFREFLRRPRRQNSLETLGLIALDYPHINSLSEQSMPAPWRQRGKTLQEWRAFLKLIVDFFIRANGAVDIPRDFLRWLGVPGRITFLVGPGAQAGQRFQRYWPQAAIAGERSRIVRLAATFLGLDPHDGPDRAELDEVLGASWDQLRPMLKRYPDGYLIRLEEKAEMVEVSQAWVCPYTHRLLDKTIDRLTPYLPYIGTDIERCKPIEMPQLPWPFREDHRGRLISEKAVSDWLETDPKVLEARRLAVWPELSDRIVSLIPYFRVVEHSAQQEGRVLRDYEDRFKRGRVNVLSCSTTMEMGVDIGGLSSVAMNNPPPSPANFLQRAGRAGRRGESTASSLTLCKNSPHGEAIFANPLWPFTSQIHVPRVSLQSERIVERHVNALTLAHFLGQTVADIPRLTSGWFFEATAEGGIATADRFIEWCLDQQRLQDATLVNGLKQLTTRTRIQGVRVDHLLDHVAAHIRGVHERWQRELDALVNDRAEVARLNEKDPPTPAELAIDRQLARLRGEYLLGELAGKGFLPGYGFPTNVVPFIPTTLEELRRQTRRKADNEREDNRGRFRNYPSRELAVGMREYAPGADIVLDGRVYRSSGVTLNWHIPPGDKAVQELQSFRHAWRCRSCGGSGTTPNWTEVCPVCESDNIVREEYLQPSGFAVDIRYEPHNDISAPTYVPVKEPWISVGGEPWVPLPTQRIGRYRYNAMGHVFHHSGGLNDEGFAVCLRCGRADSMEPGGDLPRSLHNHTRLRGGREQTGETRCDGNNQDWAIKRNVWLGIETWTDVVELQILDTGSGDPIEDKTTAYSLAVALRQALAETLGIDERELGCAAMESRALNDSPTWSIVLYDTAVGGAGYVSALPANLRRVFARARHILDCPRSCDSACHACLLDFDTQHQVDHLDRLAALSVVTSQLLDALSLPEDACWFGPTSQAESDTLDKAIKRELGQLGMSEVRLFLAGDPAQWDFGEWSLRNDLLRWIAEGKSVLLVTTIEKLRHLDADTSNALASLLEASSVKLHALASIPEPTNVLGAEVLGNDRRIRWGLESDQARAPGPSWATGEDGVRCIRVAEEIKFAPFEDRALRPEELRRLPEGMVREIVVSGEFDGPIGEFGHRLWTFLVKQVPDLAKHIVRAGAIERIEYTDRYLRSPLSMRLLYELTRGLASAPGLITSATELRVTTARLEHRQGSSAWQFHHDWDEQSVRQNIFRKAFSEVFANAQLNDQARAHALPHARSLTLVWEDGSSLPVKFDQGLGFWGTKTRQVFDFTGYANRQAAALLATDVRIGAKSDEHSTLIYVGQIGR